MTSRYSIYLGDTLRSLRQERGLTLRDVHKRAALALGYISEVERSQKEPSAGTLEALCDVYGVTLSNLLRTVADSMDLAMLDWAHENTMPADRLPAGPRAR